MPAPTPAPSESLASPLLWLAFLIMMLVGGIGNSFPVFFPALLAEFGGSRAATALTVTLMWTASAVIGPFAGYVVSRGDPRWLMTIGLLVSAGGLIVGAMAPTLRVFALAVGVGMGIGVGLTGMVMQAAVIADTYVRRRGFATGIAFSGSMAGYVLAIPAHWAITSFGWRGALLGWSVGVFALLPLVWWAYPARLGLDAPRMPKGTHGRGGEHGRGEAREPVLSSIFSVPFASLALLFSIAPFVGYLATTQHAVYAAAIGFSAWEALVSRIASTTAFGTIFGVLAIGNNLGAAAGPLLSGLIYDATHSYLAVYVTAVVFVLVALAALMVFVRTTSPAPGRAS